MPLYEYQCESCGRRTEALQRMSDAPLTACPHCGGALKKLLSAPAFQLKGSGWYATDYAKKPAGESKSAAADDKGSKPPETPAAKESSAPSAASSSAAETKSSSAAKPE